MWSDAFAGLLYLVRMWSKLNLLLVKLKFRGVSVLTAGYSLNLCGNKRMFWIIHNSSNYRATNAHIILHKTLLKHLKTLRHVSILSDHHQGALFLTKIMLQYSQFNSYLQTCCCGSISCVGMCCGAVGRSAYYSAFEADRPTAPQHVPTQHDMLPQQLVCKYELNCEHCNMTLARNKAPWWWSDKIETCQSVLKCFKSVLCEIICAFVGW